MTAPRVERAAATTARLDTRLANSSAMTTSQLDWAGRPTQHPQGGGRPPADTPEPWWGSRLIRATAPFGRSVQLQLGLRVVSLPDSELGMGLTHRLANRDDLPSVE